MIADPFHSAQYLLTSRCSIYTFNTLDATLTLIAGDSSCGYKDSVATSALFNGITHLVPSPEEPGQVWILDSDNHCIRTLDLIIVEVQTFAGLCKVMANSDGVAASARFGKPVALSVNPKNAFESVLYDNEYLVLKHMFFDSETNEWIVETYLTWEEKCRSLSYDPSANYIYLVYSTGIGRVGLDNGTVEYITGHNGIGQIDGAADTASFYNARNILFLQDSLFLVVDYGNFRLRIVDAYNETISSLCVAVKVVSQTDTICVDERPVFISVHHTAKDKLALLTVSNVYELDLAGWDCIM
ncbi:hypothetical protein EB796_020035 [Bugula neritina]|uniref:Uncharacterized protein n=1 Tax=Bugula neritina TaxID=10212 RepID=A0A7J7J8H0_BUGNE|nr:hypothetical protein EB796_020035 [Bugula neritina]